MPAGYAGILHPRIARRKSANVTGKAANAIEFGGGAAARRSNVAFYPVDSRGLVAIAAFAIEKSSSTHAPGDSDGLYQVF